MSDAFWKILGFLYETHPDSTKPGSYWFIDEEYAPEVETFQSGEWVKVGHFEPKLGGRPVDIYENRMPAQFFKVVAHPWTNSVGEPSPGFTLSTGSGDKMGRLMFRLARGIAEGMVYLCVDGEARE